MTVALRRVADVLIATVGLVTLLPVFAVVAVMIKLSSPGPVLHGGVRVGRHGRQFRLLKFRTMRVGASWSGPAITRSGDPRITRVGAVLRRTKLDELPQLLNVVAGDMSLVGPRPEDPRYVALYDDRQRRVLEVRPGITGAASVQFRDEERILAAAGEDLEAAYLEVMRTKLEIDLAYLERRTLRSDVALVVATVRAIAR